MMMRGATRYLLFLFGLLSIFWSILALCSFSLMAPAREASTKIIADQRFKPGALAEILARMRARPQLPVDNSEIPRSQALIALRSAEELMTKRPEEADRLTELSESRLKAALSMRPGDSFLWLLLYSVVTVRNGFNPVNVAYLERSYGLGPNEGWIALRRNGLALAIFSSFCERTQNLVTTEFSQLVDGGFIEDAAQNLLSVGWAQRDRLSAALIDVDASSKKKLQSRLLSSGVRFHIPGVELEERPWRR